MIETSDRKWMYFDYLFVFPFNNNFTIKKTVSFNFFSPRQNPPLQCGGKAVSSTVDEGESIAAGITSIFKWGASMQGFFKAWGAPPLSLVFIGSVVFHYPFFQRGGGVILQTRYFYTIFANFVTKNGVY